MFSRSRPHLVSARPTLLGKSSCSNGKLHLPWTWMWGSQSGSREPLPGETPSQAASGCRMEGAWLSSASKPLSTVGAEVGQWWGGGGRLCPAWWPGFPPPPRRLWLTLPPAHPIQPAGTWLELRAWTWPRRINQSRQCGSSLIKVQGFNRSFKNPQITPTPGPATWPAAPGTRQLPARPVEARPGRGSCLFPEDAGRRASPTFSAAFNLP